MTYIEEARHIAAQCWCDDETEHIEMDAVLAEAVARRIAAWMDSAAQFLQNKEFYHGIVTQIGEMFGEAAKTSDDGSIQQDVLALKVPELVAYLIQSKPSSGIAAGSATLKHQSMMKSPTDTNNEAGSDCQERLVRLCGIYEDLGKLQPRLEYLHPRLGWVKSGLQSGSLSPRLVGRYREIIEPNAIGEARAKSATPNQNQTL